LDYKSLFSFLLFSHKLSNPTESEMEATRTEETMTTSKRTRVQKLTG